MQVLVNYDPAEHRLLGGLGYHLKAKGLVAAATNKTLTATELQEYARKCKAQCIILCNPKTLANIVPSEKPTLDAWRGSRIDLQPVPVIVINPIAHIWSVNEGEWILRKDLDKVRYCGHKIQSFKYTVLNKTSLFPEWLDILSKAIVIGADIETDQHGMKKKEKTSKRVPCFNVEDMDIKGLGETWITCCGFSALMPDGTIETCVLPLVDANAVDHWDNDADYAAALDFMRKAMALPAPKCFHNGLYDAFHLIRYRAWPKRWTLDTMGLSHSWYSELPKTLNYLASWTLYDAYYWKDMADKEHKVKGGMHGYWMYNAKDCWAMVRSLKYMLLNGDQWMFTNYKQQFKLVYPSLYGAFEGWRMDLEARDRLRDEAAKIVAENKARLQTIAGDPNFNPASWQQREHLLYNIMGAKKPNRGKSTSKTDKKSRQYVAAQHPLLMRISELMNKFSENSKAYGTYFNFLIWNGRLLYSLDPFGTDTSRFSSRGSAAWVGTQIQNQPPYAKEMYVPDPGYIGFELDYSKAEAVCSAYLSQCMALIEALCYPPLDKNGEPKDFYKYLGELFFGMPYEEVTKEFRNKVLKKINHGTNYMMRGDTFIDSLDSIEVLYFAASLLDIVLTPRPSKKNEMTMKAFATKLLDSYHSPFPEVSAWWEKVKQEIIATGKLVNPVTGHTRVFFGNAAKDHKIQRSGVAHQPQNFSVSLLNGGFFKAYQYSQQLGADSQSGKSILRLKTQIHDSINGQVLIEHAATVIPYLAELIKARATVHGREMVINVDVEVYHTNWKEKVSWSDFSKTILPTLVNQSPRIAITAG